MFRTCEAKVKTVAIRDTMRNGNNMPGFENLILMIGERYKLAPFNVWIEE